MTINISSKENYKPFPRSYWFLEGVLMGGFYPGDKSQEECIDKLNQLKACGINSIINLMEFNEIDYNGNQFYEYEPHLPSGMRYQRFPIKDRSIPTKEFMTSILEYLVHEITSGQTLYLHCRGGIGRTGIVTACYLKHYKPDITNYFDWINTKRKQANDPKSHWQSPDTSEQAIFVENF